MSQNKEIENHKEVLFLEQAQLAELFFASIDHAQGSVSLHSNILKILHFKTPKLVINQKQIVILNKEVRPLIYDFILSENNSNFVPQVLQRFLYDKKETLDRYIRIQISNFATEFIEQANPPSDWRQRLLPSLAGVIAQQDEFNLIQRPQSYSLSQLLYSDYNYRSYEGSYLCHFALEGNPTGIKMLDQMYKDLREYFYLNSTELITGSIKNVVSDHLIRNQDSSIKKTIVIL